MEFKNYSVVKMGRVWQSAFYMLKHDREQICERDTNKLEWKKAKHYINDEFFKRIGEYNPFGPKEEQFKSYQKLKFIEHNLEGYEPE